ncbi:hypothetical protein KP509_1Z298900 [Ceratopteris richardii]|nr:hypothetical protein KP509_1Z298900 [Ceratopteris richardii]
MNEQLMPDKQEEKLKVVQGWDLSKYYPVTLPLQKPGSREVDAEDQCGELDENAIPAADELGLMEPSDDDRYIFFQLPSFCPSQNLAQWALQNPLKIPSQMGQAEVLKRLITLVLQLGWKIYHLEKWGSFLSTEVEQSSFNWEELVLRYVKLAFKLLIVEFGIRSFHSVPNSSHLLSHIETFLLEKSYLKCP